MSNLSQWREVLDQQTGTTRYYHTEMLNLLKAGEDEVARLRAQNKESSDAWTKRTAKMEKDLAYFRGLFGRAIKWATKTHSGGKCPICHQPLPPSQASRIAGHSQYGGALVALDYAEKLEAALGSVLVLTEGNDTPAHWFAIQQIAKETLELLDAK
jgi:hypothetical protein